MSLQNTIKEKEEKRKIEDKKVEEYE